MAFTEKTADYIRQLMASQVLAYTVGIAVIVAAIITFMKQIILAVIAAVLAFFAAVHPGRDGLRVGFAGRWRLSSSTPLCSPSRPRSG